MGGSSYSAGTGINISGTTISVDTSTVAMQSDLTDLVAASSLSTVAFSGSYPDLLNKPNIPVSTSDLNNDSGYITKSVNNLDNYTLTSNLAAVATSGSYNDLTDKPTIPTVNNNTITITQGGVIKGSFTLNQNTNATIDVDDVPGMIGEVIFSSASGSTDLTLTMAHSFEDYSYVDIQWINNDGITNSTRIYEPNGKTVNLLSANVVSTLYIDKVGIYSLSGTAMTQVSKGQGAMVNGNNSIVDYKDNTQTSDYIKITKVIGYKQNSSALTTET